MSFDKNYPNRKDHRKQYTGAKACDRSCRNHGGCDYCKNNRLHQYNKEQQRSMHELNPRHERNPEFDNNRDYDPTYEDQFEDDEQWWNSLSEEEKSAYYRWESEQEKDNRLTDQEEQ